MFSGTENFFRPGYRANLVSAWLPALDGVVDKLQRGAKVADIGCGHGASTIVMASAFPKSRFFGFDSHPASIKTATERAEAAGVAGQTTFVEATAKSYEERDFDLICFFDCLHDMGDPVGAMRRACEALTDDGTVMLVEPFANDALDQNMTPVGRMYYAASTFICTPNSLSQEVGLGLGAQAGEARLRDVSLQAGFTRFRRAAETPFNIVFEARK
jgi:cyclopropane fatty-acyl-phospholipid synthase-like methyltransferase